MFIAPDKVRSKYRFVNICAQRTRQILDGATQRVDLNVKKPAFVAMQEVLADKVEWTVKEDRRPRSARNRRDPASGGGALSSTPRRAPPSGAPTAPPHHESRRVP